MSLSRSRIISAIKGAFVADSASMGTHWIYKPDEMASAVPSIDEPEFKDPPNPSFYSADEFPGHYGPGMLSPYGEQLLFVSEHLAESGEIDGANMCEEMFRWAGKEYSGRPDGAIKTFLENVEAGKKFPECGADDNQAHCFMKAIPVACAFAGKPQLKAQVEEAVRVHQNNDVAVQYGVAASAILEHAILKGSLPDADFVSNLSGDALESWNKATQSENLEELLLSISHEVMVGKEDSPHYDLYGRSCILPGSFIAPCFLFQSTGMDYVKAIRSNILGAGDTCSRAIFLGAVFGAALGDPPQSWLDKMDKPTLERVEKVAQKLADLAGAE